MFAGNYVWDRYTAAKRRNMICFSRFILVTNNIWLKHRTIFRLSYEITDTYLLLSDGYFELWSITTTTYALFHPVMMNFIPGVKKKHNFQIKQCHLSPSVFWRHKSSNRPRRSHICCSRIRVNLNRLPISPCFLGVCSTSRLKTLWENEKLLVRAISHFSSVFYPFG